MNTSTEGFQHIPVLKNAVLENLTFDPERPARFIDGTVGGGGHSALLLEKYGKLELLGIDRDDMALNAASKRLEFAGNRVTLVRGCYADLAALAVEHGWDEVDGVLLDIGVSSPQLDIAERGFSWRNDAVLDMRMDRRSELTAGRWLNRTSEAEMARVFREYGEIRQAGKLARKAVEFREKKPFAMTSDLVALCDAVLGRAKPGTLPHPTLVFQAVRIAVNDELKQLETGLRSAVGILVPGGRVAVISFHSLEDRIVKNYFRQESTECICPPGLPVCCCGHKAQLRLVTRRAVTAEKEEVAENSRSACAKLRAAEKI
ncbi:MAG: 16S rRNA (cytosine(1402)-N(4))-methyltransferase RsmH [Lentisphaeria bacterium]|nr:16S rRNA (cytosine(1402)-N(4))-methyltransferase RsmH [Lentisphaeria bacterium]